MEVVNPPERLGYFRLAQIGGVKLFVHWSLPLGGLLIALVMHAHPDQWGYFILSYLLLIIIHEAGHVLAALALGCRVFSVEISGLGGLCRIERPRRFQDSVIAYSAGLLAQFVAFSFAVGYVDTFGFPKTPFAAALDFTFTYVNVALFVFNLIPQRNPESGFATDGSVLWRLFLHKFRGHRHPHPPLVAAPLDQSPIFPSDTRLLEKPGFRPANFMHGIEILNDNTTPMEFVVKTLMTHLGLTQNQAAVKMLEIHNTGGMLVALPSPQESRRIAAAISAEARAAGHSFVCRYVGPEALEL